VRPRPGAARDADLFTHIRQHVLETYRSHSSNKAETARALGISRRTLYRLLEKYDVSRAGQPRRRVALSH
jgi:DNA-binding NtrC family response regulator